VLIFFIPYAAFIDSCVTFVGEMPLAFTFDVFVSLVSSALVVASYRMLRSVVQLDHTPVYAIRCVRMEAFAQVRHHDYKA